MNNGYLTALPHLTAIALLVAFGSLAGYQFHKQCTLRKATPNSEQRRPCFVTSIVASLVAAFSALAFAIYYPIALANGWTSGGKVAQGEWPIADIILRLGTSFSPSFKAPICYRSNSLLFLHTVHHTS